jgi:hypothetical protein
VIDPSKGLTSGGRMSSLPFGRWATIRKDTLWRENPPHFRFPSGVCSWGKGDPHSGFLFSVTDDEMRVLAIRRPAQDVMSPGDTGEWG